MDGKYTYSDSGNVSWEHEVYDTFDYAFNAASENLESFLVGQLKFNGTNYSIINVYEFEKSHYME